MTAAELGELEAFRDLYAAAPDDVGAQAQDVGGALCIRLEAAPSSAMFNRALGLGLSEPATQEGLDAIGTFLSGLGWCVALAPQAEPPELPAWLERRGFSTGYGWTKFARDLGQLPRPRTELRVERVEEGRADAFAEAFVRGYGTPEFFGEWLASIPGRDGWHCFVALDGEVVAGTGALYVSAPVGWLGIAATVPEHRRKGAQGAILAARIEAAAAAGCEVVVTETGAPVDGQPGGSYRNIVRAGFEPQYVRANYLSTPEADTSGTT
jgi:hypothetical protein